MKDMGWRNEYQLGIPAIDLQHQRIFECLLTMAELSARQDRLRAEFAVVRLLTLLQQHSALEESMMRKFGYPGLAPHIEEHRRFHGDMHELAQTCLGTKTSITLAAVKAFHLRQREHVMTSDRDYVEYFRGLPHNGGGRETGAKPTHRHAGAGMARKLHGPGHIVHGESQAEFV
jgi:hemerythrin